MYICTEDKVNFSCKNIFIPRFYIKPSHLKYGLDTTNIVERSPENLEKRGLNPVQTCLIHQTHFTAKLDSETLRADLYIIIEDITLNFDKKYIHQQIKCMSFIELEL